MDTDIATPKPELQQETVENTIKCPDCETESPRPQAGTYKCTQCFCKFSINTDGSMNIIPFFDEMKLEPILVMLAVPGMVLLVGMSDEQMPFMQRLNIFLVFVAVGWGGFKLIHYLCRRYRGVDRFFRKISRPRFAETEKGLIKMKSTRSD